MKTEIEKIQEEYKALGERIEALKNEKPKFEQGWYKHKDNCCPSWLVHLNTDKSYYGFDVSSQWITGSDMLRYITQNCEPATSSEVEQRFIAEAKKQYPYKTKMTNKYGEPDQIGSSFFMEEDGLYNNGFKRNIKLFDLKTGKWSPIEVKDQPILIGGYELKIENNTVFIGCKKYSNHQLHALSVLMKDSGFKTVQFDERPPVSLDQINLILERLK